MCYGVWSIMEYHFHFGINYNGNVAIELTWLQFVCFVVTTMMWLIVECLFTKADNPPEGNLHISSSL